MALGTGTGGFLRPVGSGFQDDLAGCLPGFQGAVGGGRLSQGEAVDGRGEAAGGRFGEGAQFQGRRPPAFSSITGPRTDCETPSTK